MSTITGTRKSIVNGGLIAGYYGRHPRESFHATADIGYRGFAIVTTNGCHRSFSVIMFITIEQFIAEIV
jgi:hypothetical protein